MRTETKVVTYYTIHELSEKAREKALENWNSHDDYHWYRDNANSLKWFEERFNLDIDDYHYASFGRTYIKFKSRLDGILYDEGAVLEGQRLANWLMYHHFDDLYEGKWYYKNYPKKRQSKVMFQERCPTGYCMDYSLLQPIRDFIKSSNKYWTYDDLMRDCLESWLDDCQSDWEYSQSMEHFIEMCDANDYEFDEHGEMV